LWDVQTGHYLRDVIRVDDAVQFTGVKVSDTFMYPVSFSPDGRTLMTSSEQGIQIFGITSTATHEACSISLVNTAVHEVADTALSPENIPSIRQLREFEIPQSPENMAFSMGGSYFMGKTESLAWVWDLQTTALLSPTGATLAEGGYVNITTWKADEGEMISTQTELQYPFGRGGWDQFVYGDNLYTVTWSQTAGLNPPPQGLTIWKRLNEEIAYTLDEDTYIREYAISPTQQFIVTVTWEGTVSFWDTTNGTRLHTLDLAPYHPTDVVFSLDGRYFAVIGESDAAADMPILKLFGLCEP
jgi:WD40 repeat protein